MTGWYVWVRDRARRWGYKLVRRCWRYKTVRARVRRSPPPNLRALVGVEGLGEKESPTPITLTAAAAADAVAREAHFANVAPASSEYKGLDSADKEGNRQNSISFSGTTSTASQGGGATGDKYRGSATADSTPGGPKYVTDDFFAKNASDHDAALGNIVSELNGSQVLGPSPAPMSPFMNLPGGGGSNGGDGSNGRDGAAPGANSGGSGAGAVAASNTASADGQTLARSLIDSGANAAGTAKATQAAVPATPVTPRVTTAAPATNASNPPASASAASASASAQDSKKTLTATGTTFQTIAGATYSGPVASFTATPSNPGQDKQFKATINWADGHTTAGTVVANGQSFSVEGQHVFRRAGTFHLVVTVSDPGRQATATSTAQVAPADPTVSVVSSSNPSVFGQPVTFTATVTPEDPSLGTPTGTVTFADYNATVGNTTTLGSATLDNNGQASLTISTLGPAYHLISGQYSGDDTFAASSGGMSNYQTVSKADTTTTVTGLPNPSTYGETVTFTVSVAAVAPGAGTPTGNVSLGVGTFNFSGTLDANGQASFTTATLPGGSYDVSAGYLGDTNFNNSGSTAGTWLTVNPADSQTTLSASANPSTYGQSVDFTATVTGVGVNQSMPGPTGSVNFSVDGSSQANVALSNGQAVFTTANLMPGSHTVMAAYNSSVGGTIDPNFNASSASLTETVNLASTTTTVSSSLNPSTYGQSVDLTAAVSNGIAGQPPAGTVTFNIDGTPQAPLNVTNGQAVLTVANFTGGSHSVRADYSGDSLNAASSGSLPTQTVNLATTTTALSVSPDPSVWGQSVTFTATVNGFNAGTPTGIVAFTDGGTLLANVGLDSSGTATFTTSSLAVGIHPIVATYRSDGNFDTSYASVAQTVIQAGTTTTLWASPSPSVWGQSVTFTASVFVSYPASGTPTGTVDFVENGTLLGSATLANGWQATFTTATLSTGVHHIVAIYNGDTNFTGSSGSYDQTVIPIANTTTLGSSPNASYLGQSVTFTATVYVASPGPAAPTGTVDFLEGGNVLGSGTLNGQLQATFSTSSLSVGLHHVVAVYNGDGNYAASASNPYTQQVVDAGPRNLTLTPNPTTLNENDTVTLDGNFTDPNNTSVEFVHITWGDGTSETLSLGAGATSFSEDHQFLDNQPGNAPFNIDVTITDQYGNSTSASTQVTVNNVAPSGISLNLSQVSILENQSVTLNGTFADPGTLDTHIVDINWADGTPDTVIHLAAGVLHFSGATHQYLDNQPNNQPYEIIVTVTDKDGDSGTSSIELDVANVTPTVTANLSPSCVYANTTVTVTGTVFDPGTLDTITLSVYWGDNSSPDTATYPGGVQSSFSFTHTYAQAGVYVIDVTATDSDGAPGNAVTMRTLDPTFHWNGGAPTWTWSFGNSSDIPIFGPPPPQTNAEGDTVSVQVDQAPAGYPFTLTYDAVGLPPGLSINASSGLISGTIDYSAAEAFAGKYGATIVVANGQGDSAAMALPWTVTDTDRKPSLIAPADQSNVGGDQVNVQVQATDPDNDQLFYDAVGLPPGLSIDSVSGVISGTIDPLAADGSPYSVMVTADDGTLSDSQTFTWTVAPGTSPPSFGNTGNQTSVGGTSAFLALTATEAAGNALTYSASGLPPGLSIDPTSGVISGTIDPSAVGQGPYTVTVLASDGAVSASQNFTWTVNAVGLDNPGDQANVNGDVVSLSLVAAGPAGATLTYSAVGLPNGLSIDSGTGVISGTIASSADSNSPYALTVSVSDGTDSASQTFTWTVAHMAITGPGDQINVEGNVVAVQVIVQESDGDALTYSAAGLPSGLSIDPNTGLISGTIGVTASGLSPYLVPVTASDGTNSATHSFVWTVTPDVILLNPGSQTNVGGDDIALAVSARSASGNTLGFAATGLPAGLNIDSSTGQITGTIDPAGESTLPYTVTVTASDGISSASQTFAWSVNHVLVVPPGDQANIDGDNVSLAIAARDGDGLSLTYAATGLPSGLTIDAASGVISGAIDLAADGSSPYTVTISATDGTYSASHSFTWTVAPRIAVANPGDQANTAGDMVSLAITAADAASASLTYSASGLPSGLNIDSTTGIISGTIAVGADSASPYTVTVTAGDGITSASQTFAWTVAHMFLVNPGDQSSADGDTVALALQAHDADGDTVTYSASGLPSGLALNSATGQIAGTIALTGHASSPYSVSITATDGTHSATQSFSWRVSHIAIHNPGDQTNLEGTAVSLAIAAADPDGDALLFSATGLPTGVAINANTGVISGTPAVGSAGAYSVTVAATDGAFSSSVSFTWTVTPQVVVAAISDQPNVEGDSVSVQVQATDTGGVPLTFSANGLPAGLSIDSSTGVISGTIAAGTANGLPHTVSVTASDGTYSTTQVFVWNVNHLNNQAPVLTNPGSQSNHEGDSVSLQVVAVDPDGDTVFYSATGLPDGLTIDPFSGAITGTITDQAVSNSPANVTVTVDDGNGGTASQTFMWMVQDAALSAQGTSLSGTEGSPIVTATLATFTDQYVLSQADSFTIQVDWGDGTTDTFQAIAVPSGQVSSFQVSGSNGSFTVTGTHTYDHPGSFSISISISDATGGSATATSTADIQAAPLTATGGLSLVGLVSPQPIDVPPNPTWTVAQFTDADPNDGPQTYQASIDWGDGSGTSSGTLEGENGTFIVKGAHDFHNHGTFTIQVTIVDQDGTTATATSTIDIGEVYKDRDVSLGIGDFGGGCPCCGSGNGGSSGSTCPPDQMFSVQISWGDGVVTSGTISVVSGQTFYAINGTHRYQQTGLFTVVATVTDLNGNQAPLTTQKTIQVVDNRVDLHTAELDVTAGQSLSNVEVGVFTVNAPSPSGTYTAQINWGDGNSPSLGTVSESGGIYRVLGSHSYQVAGAFATGVTILWDDPKPVALELDKSSVLANAQMFGPTAVPGLSQYEYTLGLPKNSSGTYPMASDVTHIRWTVGSGAKIVGQGYYVNPSGVVALWALVEFAAGPASVDVVVNFDIRGKSYSDVLHVDVIGVTIGSIGAFTFSKSPAPTSSNGTRNGAFVKVVSSGTPGLKWRAVVRLTAGPRTNTFGLKTYLSRLKIGFMQQASVVYWRSRYSPSGTFLHYSLEGQKRLDSLQSSGAPYYSNSSDAVFVGASLSNPSKVIESRDSPVGGAPIFYQQGKNPAPGDEILDGIEGLSRFTLNVVAQTKDTEVGADQYYWRMAIASWSFDFSGTVVTAAPYAYTPSTSAGVKAPAAWTPQGIPYRVILGPPTINDEEKTATFSP